MTRAVRLTEVDHEFARLVRAERIARGWGQKRLGVAIQAAMPQQTIAKIETQGRSITVGEAYALVELLFDGEFPAIDVALPDVCTSCANKPPRGFSCNACRRAS